MTMTMSPRLLEAFTQHNIWHGDMTIRPDGNDMMLQDSWIVPTTVNYGHGETARWV